MQSILLIIDLYLFKAFQLLDTITIFNDKNTVVKHLFFLFKVYYSLMVDYCTERERRKMKRNVKNNNNNLNII